MHALKRLLWLCPLLLSGCATTDDPGQGGLFGGIYGLTSGAYDKRLDERQQNLDALKNLEQQSQAEQQSLTQEKAKWKTQVQELTAQNARLSADLASLEKKLNSAQAGTAKAKVDLGKMKTKLSGLQKQAQTLKTQESAMLKTAAPDNDLLQKYAAEEKRLRNEIEMLKGDMYLLK